MDTSLHLQLTHSVNYPGGHVTYPQTATKADDINKIHTSYSRIRGPHYKLGTTFSAIRFMAQSGRARKTPRDIRQMGKMRIRSYISSQKKTW